MPPHSFFIGIVLSSLGTAFANPQSLTDTLNIADTLNQVAPILGLGNDVPIVSDIICYASLVVSDLLQPLTAFTTATSQCTTTTTVTTQVTVTPSALTSTVSETSTSVLSTSTNTLTVTATATTTSTTVLSTSTVIVTTTTFTSSTSTSVIPASSGFMPAGGPGGSLKDATNQPSGNTKRRVRNRNTEKRSLLTDWTNALKGRGNVDCYSFTPSCTTQTATSTITSTAGVPVNTVTTTLTVYSTPSADATVTTTSTTTVITTSTSTSTSTSIISTTMYSTTVTSYAACSTDNLIQYVSNQAITNGQDPSGTSGARPGGTADDSAYNCCVAAILNPIAAIWHYQGYSVGGSCIISVSKATTAQGTCPNGQQTNTGGVVKTSKGKSPAFVAGNANCGLFSIAGPDT